MSTSTFQKRSYIGNAALAIEANNIRFSICSNEGTNLGISLQVNNSEAYVSTTSRCKVVDELLEPGRLPTCFRLIIRLGNM
jgi:hypothetical protein